MQYIVITRRRSEKFPDSEYTPERLAAETAAVRRLYGEGIVRHIWHRGDVGVHASCSKSNPKMA
jgi:hypothetical protein